MAGLRVAVLLVGVAHLTGAADLPDFDAFVARHGRSYEAGSEEYDRRLAIFSQRVEEVERLNSRPGRLWTAGVNPLTDWTDAELARLRGWRGGATPGRGAGSVRRHGLFLRQTGRSRALPDEFLNWTSLEAIKEIRDQGSCGSCWAVTSATVLAAHAEIYGAQRTFSVQELLSCVPNPDSCGGSGGCDGATVELAFHWAMAQGLATADEVPYKAQTGTCRRASDTVQLISPKSEVVGPPGVRLATPEAKGMSFGMTGWERLPENKYEPLMRALVERGPVGVSVSASMWYAYDSGIFDLCQKDAVIDHAVTLIGYGRDRKLKAKYWLIQNSWGKDWGEDGRIRLLRSDGDEVDQCGTDSQPEVGTGCKGGPAEVRVCGMCGVLYDSAVPYFGPVKQN